jgi:predicted dehydrogenase
LTVTKAFGVGIIGFEPDRSWGALAHAPALRALPDFEIVAVATRRQESSAIAAAALGLSKGYDSPEALVLDSAVQVVAITVKVPEHRRLVELALAAGKHVYCEWPFGNGIQEALAMAEKAGKSKGRVAVGLQARMAPAVDFARTLIADGYVGEVLSTTLIGSGMQWGCVVDRPNAYILDRRNGATMLTIPVGHTLDAVCHCLGEFAALSAVATVRQPEVLRLDTGEILQKTAADQIAVTGVLKSGTVVAVHYRGGMTRGTGLLWEINGAEGDLRITGAGGHAQIVDLSISGARGSDREMKMLDIPGGHRWTPPELTGPAINVAQAYHRFAEDIRSGTRTCPDYNDAVIRHRMIAAIEEAASRECRIEL